MNSVQMAQGSLPSYVSSSIFIFLILSSVYKGHEAHKLAFYSQNSLLTYLTWPATWPSGQGKCQSSCNSAGLQPLP